MATRSRRNDRPLGDWRTHYEQLWKPNVATPATQPTDRMPLTAFVAARQAMRDALANFERVKPDCRTCARFEMGKCSEFGEVPKDFQETPEACESWVFDGIPF